MTITEFKENVCETIKINTGSSEAKKYKDMGYLSDEGYFYIKPEDIDKKSKVKVLYKGEELPFCDVLKMQLEEEDDERQMWTAPDYDEFRYLVAKVFPEHEAVKAIRENMSLKDEVVRLKANILALKRDNGEDFDCYIDGIKFGAEYEAVNKLEEYKKANCFRVNLTEHNEKTNLALHELESTKKLLKRAVHIA